MPSLICNLYPKGAVVFLAALLYLKLYVMTRHITIRRRNRRRRKRNVLHKWQLFIELRQPRKQRRKRSRYRRFRQEWHEHLEQLCPGEFKRRYRMSQERFDDLLHKLGSVAIFFAPLGEARKQHIRNLFGVAGIDPRHKLAAAIRWFAGGSYMDIRLVHGMGRSTIFTCVWEAVDAINAAPELALKFPWDDEVQLRKLEQGFAALSGGKVRGCVFAMDGFCIRVKAPVGVNNPRDFWHRKGFYAVVAQAVVDSSKRFLAASFKAVGSTHDSLAFKMSKFYEILESGKLDREIGLSGLTSYFGMGDDAYCNKKYLLTPWPGRDLSGPKDSHNYWQSRLRIPVECSFGDLTTRWGCLWRTLGVPVSKVCVYVYTTHTFVSYFFVYMYYRYLLSSRP